MNRASFLASFPPIQSAIKITGDENGMRVQLDIPENQMAEAVKLLAWRQTVLRVTIEPEAKPSRSGSGSGNDDVMSILGDVEVNIDELESWQL